ncbi:hypothetical protein VDG05_10830, partial [Xanthomonas campestris pv. raphani]|uniref:hypothetical protein n=1 Tax=Xanthomonas campestris TaxID=339 RepID=UPI002B22FCA0
ALAREGIPGNASRAQARSYKGVAVAREAMRVRPLHNYWQGASSNARKPAASPSLAALAISACTPDR